MNIQSSARLSSATIRLRAPTAAAMALALLLLPAAGPLRADMRDFKSAKGAVVRAELKKAKGMTIFLRTADGRDIQVPLQSFSAEDQTFILKWMADDPNALDYNFAIRTTEKQLLGKKESGGDNRGGDGRGGPGFGRGGFGRKITSVEKNYGVEITNNARAPIQDVAVDWCAFLLDRVNVRRQWDRFGPQGFRPGSKDEKDQSDKVPATQQDENSNQVLRVKRGSQHYPRMESTSLQEFQTPAFDVETQEGSPKISDRLVGMWLRFYRGETLIYEWKSPGCPKAEWPGGTHRAPPKPDPEPGAPPDTSPPAIAGTSSPGGKSGSAPGNAGSMPRQPAPASSSTPKLPPPASSSSEDDDVIVKMFELDEKK